MFDSKSNQSSNEYHSLYIFTSNQHLVKDAQHRNFEN